MTVENLLGYDHSRVIPLPFDHADIYVSYWL